MCRSPIFCILVVCSACAVWAAPPEAEDKSVRKLHFIQDDAQDYMVSKLYELKYAQANDLVPFVQGMIIMSIPVVWLFPQLSAAVCVTTNANRLSRRLSRKLPSIIQCRTA